MLRKTIRKSFKSGDKIIALPEADFHYPLKECILEVEYQLTELQMEQTPSMQIIQHNAADMELKDTYVHIWKSRDKISYWKVGKKSFAICSMYFRLVNERDIGEFLLDDL